MSGPSSLHPKAKTQRRILLAAHLSDRAFLQGVTRFARKHDWQLITDMLHTGRLPKRWDGDGILAYLPYQSDITSFVAGIETPCVTISITDHCKAIPRISADDFAIGELAAQHLYDRNCREFLWAPFFDNQQNWDRYSGFNHRLKELSCNCRSLPPAHLEQTDNWDLWRPCALEQLKESSSRIGIFCFNDCLSSKIAGLAKEIGRTLPEDMAILGVGNNDIECEAATIRLSSIDPDLEEMATLAASILDKLIAGKACARNATKVKPKGVVERESTSLTGKSCPRVSKALSYLSEHYSDSSLSVSAVADAVGISRRQLERDFRTEQGQTVREYIEFLRLEEASRLLSTQPRSSVARIASQVGFAASGNFFRIFRKRFGLTPASFRQQKRAPYTL